MASLKNRRGTWYARVLWYEEQKKKEKQIPLRTESKVTARQRLTMVIQVEDEIKKQIDEAVEFARQSPYPDPSELFDDMFANPIPLD